MRCPLDWYMSATLINVQAGLVAWQTHKIWFLVKKLASGHVWPWDKNQLVFRLHNLYLFVTKPVFCLPVNYLKWDIFGGIPWGRIFAASVLTDSSEPREERASHENENRLPRPRTTIPFLRRRRALRTTVKVFQPTEIAIRNQLYFKTKLI